MMNNDHLSICSSCFSLSGCPMKEGNESTCEFCLLIFFLE